MRSLKRQGGFTVAEAVIATLLLSFVIASAAALMAVGQRQQRIGRNYSEVQTDLRTALRRATRTIRHGYAVINPSASANFPVTASNANQVIVRVPEPTGASPAYIEVRIHLSNGVMYAQRSDQSAPGAPLIEGVQALALNYYQTIGSARTSVDGAPQQATEVQITLTAVRDSAVATVVAYVTLRNVIAGSL